MSVFKKNGSWFVRYRDIQGHQREKKAGTTKAIALELERKLLSDRDYQKNFGYKPKQDITFANYLDEYLERIKIRVKETTFRARSYVLNKMNEFLGDKKLIDLTEEDFFSFFKKTKASNKSVKYYLRIFKGVLSEASRGDYRVANLDIKICKKETVRVRYLTEEEAEKILLNSGDLKLIIIMALTTGMRKGEMLNLTWQDVDLNSRLIHIEESKNGERRSVPINTDLYNELMSIKNKTEKVFNILNFKKKFAKILVKCNITNFHFHDLRHTFASWLAMKGVSLYTIKELLGHKSILMTQRYAHLSPDSRFAAVELIKVSNI